jgi:hypothetical protein
MLGSTRFLTDFTHEGMHGAQSHDASFGLELHERVAAAIMMMCTPVCCVLHTDDV